MFAMAYPYDTRQHCLLKGSELHHWLDRNFPGQNLVLYRHIKEGTFVIAQRMNDGQLIDVLNLGVSLGVMDRQRAANLRFLFSGFNTVSHLKRRFQEESSECLDYHTTKGCEAEEWMHRRTPSTKTSVLIRN